jgi:hypothetical protein
MHSESKVWLIAGLGIATLVAGMFMRAYSGPDSPPTAAIFDPMEAADSVRFHQRPQQVLAQPTILQADAATMPLMDKPLESPLRENLASPGEPAAQNAQLSPSHRILMPLSFIRDDLPLVPPANPIQQP